MIRQCEQEVELTYSTFDLVDGVLENCCHVNVGVVVFYSGDIINL